MKIFQSAEFLPAITGSGKKSGRLNPAEYFVDTDDAVQGGRFKGLDQGGIFHNCNDVARSVSIRYTSPVTLNQIQQEAIALPERERADLLCKLLETFPAAGTDVSDAEVAARDRELENGTVQELSHEEFVRRVRSERGR